MFEEQTRNDSVPNADERVVELTLVPDQGRNVAAEMHAMDVIDGRVVPVVDAYKESLQSAQVYNEGVKSSIAPESVAEAYNSSLQSASTYNEGVRESVATLNVADAYKESLQAASNYNEGVQGSIAAVQAEAIQTPPKPPSMFEQDVAEVSKEISDFDPVGESIEAAAKEAKLADPITVPESQTEVPLPVNETKTQNTEVPTNGDGSSEPKEAAWRAMQRQKGIIPDEPFTLEQQKMANYFAEANAKELAYQEGKTVLGKIKLAGQAINNKMAEMGAGIEVAELAKAEEDLVQNKQKIADAERQKQVADESLRQALAFSNKSDAEIKHDDAIEAAAVPFTPDQQRLANYFAEQNAIEAKRNEAFGEQVKERMKEALGYMDKVLKGEESMSLPKSIMENLTKAHGAIMGSVRFMEGDIAFPEPRSHFPNFSAPLTEKIENSIEKETQLDEIKNSLDILERRKKELQSMEAAHSGQLAQIKEYEEGAMQADELSRNASRRKETLIKKAEIAKELAAATEKMRKAIEEDMAA